jgi:hypothetical protein
MKNLLKKHEKQLLTTIEKGGFESMKQNAIIWCYLDGKRNGCNTFDERIEQLIMPE